MALPAIEHPEAWPPVNTHAPCACFGARADLIGILDGKRTVVEVKTSTKMQATDWFQSGAQRRMAGANADLVLLLGRDGTYQLPKRPAWADVTTVWRQIQAAATVAHWRLAHDPKAQLSGDGPHALRRADGVRVPGVGTVLRLAGLVDLRDVPPDILATAAARGTMVHRYLEMLYDGQGGLEAESIAPALRGYVASWWRWVEATGFQVEAVETPLVWDCGGSGDPRPAREPLTEEQNDLLWGVRRDLEDQAREISRLQAFGLLEIIDVLERAR